MKTSESISEIATALSKAQSKLENAVYNKTNPHFKSKYADLASVRDAIIPIMSSHDISIIQTTKRDDSCVVLVTTMLHKSGEFISSEYPVLCANQTPQAMGSALTYARRYSLAAIAGIAAEDDDDGNVAQQQQPKPQQKQDQEQIPKIVFLNENNITSEYNSVGEWLNTYKSLLSIFVESANFENFNKIKNNNNARYESFKKYKDKNPKIFDEIDNILESN